jgi:hypothetical protein
MGPLHRGPGLGNHRAGAVEEEVSAVIGGREQKDSGQVIQVASAIFNTHHIRGYYIPSYSHNRLYCTSQGPCA